MDNPNTTSILVYGCLLDQPHPDNSYPVIMSVSRNYSGQTSDTPKFAVGLTPEEKTLYSQLFRALDPDGSGIVTGEKARATFEKSDLPPSVLGEIWQLADQDNVGFLTQFGFCYAMRLIGATQAGNRPSPALAEKPGPLPRFSGLPLLLGPGANGTHLQPQGTNSSLLQTQPSASVPLSVGQPQSQEPVAPVSAADYQRFSQMYIKTTGSATALLDGASARDIFLKAKLPTDTLGRIWGLVDVNNRGALDLPAFVMAMHLIHGVLSGTLRTLPPFLPPHVWLSVQGQASERLVSNASAIAPGGNASFSSGSAIRSPLPAGDWVVSAAQKQQMDAIFDSLDKEHTGQLGADQVASFLMTSRLDQQDLASIWDLADIQNTGVFGRVEFGIALFLVNRRRAGQSLPNVVPDSLIASLRLTKPQQAQSQPPAPSQPTHTQITSSQLFQGQPAQPLSAQQTLASSGPLAAPPQPRSALDDLADIFSSPAPSKPALQSTSSSSDLTSAELPKVRKQATSSFVPTSSFKPTLTFGQTLLQSKDTSLIGDDVSQAKPQTPVEPPKPKSVDTPKAVDYEALRSVPPPPPKARDSSQASVQSPVSSPYSAQPPHYSGQEVNKPLNRETFQPPQPTTQSSQYDFPSPVRGNSDLLADPNSEISGKLSEATSDIANISNQVKSLSGQTSNLHEKKIRSEQELARILAVKEDIEAKLRQLRASYTNEVKQVEQVEANLASAQEENEALRSEASISEAKLNQISGELNEKQVAVEELQKTNSALKEKLGYMNAEISELEKLIEAKVAENKLLSNEVSIKKSQLQVAIVKVDDFKRSITDLETSNVKLKEELERAHQERVAAENHARELQLQQEKLQAQQKELQAQSEAAKKLSGSNIGAKAISAVAGAVVGGAAAVGAHALSSGSNEAKTSQEVPSEATPTGRKVSEPIPSATESAPSAVSAKDVSGPSANNSTTSESAEQKMPGSLDFDDLPDATVSGSDVANIHVDQLVEKPSSDMTGLDSGMETKELEATEYEPEDLDGLKRRFPEVDYDQTDQTVSSSGVTGSFRPTEGAETPVTSPENSEYRFLSANAGVVGSMVGMPGVLVGVQRTDSLTSSVQNNASMSVRDDNIDNDSERETLGEDPTGQADVGKEIKVDGQTEDSSEGEHHSSGVGLFELVNAEDAKGPESQSNVTDATVLTEETVSVHPRTTDEEFPPIKELDYDESSSSSDEESPENFDDAVDNLGTGPSPESEFDDDFNSLAPAEEEKTKEVQDDFFDEEFDGLTAANEDKEVFDSEPQDISIDDHFTGAAEVNEFDGTRSAMPDFSAAGSGAQDSNDEWEQLFAGFGSAGAVAPAGASQTQASHDQPSVQDSSKDLAIEELVGMGFEKDVVLNALQKENWNIEAATNYLLDNA